MRSIITLLACCLCLFSSASVYIIASDFSGGTPSRTSTPLIAPYGGGTTIIKFKVTIVKPKDQVLANSDLVGYLKDANNNQIAKFWLYSNLAYAPFQYYSDNQVIFTTYVEPWVFLPTYSSTGNLVLAIESNGSALYTGSSVSLITSISNNTVSGSQYISRNSDPASFTGSTPVGGNGNFQYKWESSPDNATWSAVPLGTGQTLDPYISDKSMYYRRIVTSDAATSTSNVVFTKLAVENNTVTPQTQKIVANNTPELLAGSNPVSNVGGTVTYKWKWATNIGQGAYVPQGFIEGATGKDLQLPSTARKGIYHLYQRVAYVGSYECASDWAYIHFFNEVTIENNTISPASQTVINNTSPKVLTGSQPTIQEASTAQFIYQWQVAKYDTRSSSIVEDWSNIDGATSRDYRPSTFNQPSYYQLKYRRIVKVLGYSTQENISNEATISGIGKFIYDPVGVDLSEVINPGINITVYPNPANEVIFILYDDSRVTQQLIFRIRDLAGNDILSGIVKNNEAIQLPQLETGKYEIEVFSEDYAIKESELLYIIKN